MKTLKDLLDAYGKHEAQLTAGQVPPAPVLSPSRGSADYHRRVVSDVCDLERFARSHGYELRVELNVAAYNDKVRRELEELRKQRAELDKKIEAKSGEFLPKAVAQGTQPRCTACGVPVGFAHAPECLPAGLVAEGDTK